MPDGKRNRHIKCTDRVMLTTGFGARLCALSCSALRKKDARKVCHECLNRLLKMPGKSSASIDFWDRKKCSMHIPESLRNKNQSHAPDGSEPVSAATTGRNPVDEQCMPMMPVINSMRDCMVAIIDCRGRVRQIFVFYVTEICVTHNKNQKT